MKVPALSHCLQSCIVSCFNFTCSSGSIVFCHYGVNVHFHDDKGTGYLFIWLFGFTLFEVLAKSFNHFLIFGHLICFFLISRNSLCVSGTSLLLYIHALQIYSSHLVYLLTLLYVSFDKQKFLFLMRSYFVSFSFMVSAFYVFLVYSSYMRIISFSFILEFSCSFFTIL